MISIENEVSPIACTNYFSGYSMYATMSEDMNVRYTTPSNMMKSYSLTSKP